MHPQSEFNIPNVQQTVLTQAALCCSPLARSAWLESCASQLLQSSVQAGLSLSVSSSGDRENYLSLSSVIFNDSWISLRLRWKVSVHPLLSTHLHMTDMQGLQTWNIFKYMWEKEQFNGSEPVSRERKSDYSPEISRKLFTWTEVVYRGANWCKISLSLGAVWISVTWGPGSVLLKLGFIPGKVAKMGNSSFHSLEKQPVCIQWQHISENKHLFFLSLHQSLVEKETSYQNIQRETSSQTSRFNSL